MTVTIDAGETYTACLPLFVRLRNGARPQPDWTAAVVAAVTIQHVCAFRRAIALWLNSDRNGR